MVLRADGKPDLDKLLAEMIDRAIARFGPRHRANWSIAPVSADRDDYPTTLFYAEQQQIKVHVTQPAADNINEARYQLGHEAVHCVLASGLRKTIYFEEGLANWFALSLEDLPKKFRAKAKDKLDPVLKRPLSAFIALRPTDERIASLRAEAPDPETLTKELVEKHFKAPGAVAEPVCRHMGQDRPDRM